MKTEKEDLVQNEELKNVEQKLQFLNKQLNDNIIKQIIYDKYTKLKEKGKDCANIRTVNTFNFSKRTFQNKQLKMKNSFKEIETHV